MFVSLGSANSREKYHARWRRSRSWLRSDHVAPASSDRYTPPLGSFAISAQTRFGLAGEIAMPTLPMIPVGNPGLRVISVQCSPPSVVLKMPPPAPPLIRSHGLRPACQSAAYRTSGLLGSITSSIAPVESLRKRIRFQVL